MKTNQIMMREQGFTQRTKDGYFNANELATFHFKGKDKHTISVKINNWYNNKQTKQFEQQLISEGIERPKISGRGKNSTGTWLHPKMFVDFAMWLSPKFKSKVIDMVLDGLIASRHSAGDYYNEMCTAIINRYFDYYGHKPPATLYQTEANRVKKLLNINKDRNELTETELQNITILQKVNSNLITKGVGLVSRVNQLEMVAESLTGNYIRTLI